MILFDDCEYIQKSNHDKNNYEDCSKCPNYMSCENAIKKLLIIGTAKRQAGGTV